jgi:predicted DNA-binding transcriptional regulator AlpA
VSSRASERRSDDVEWRLWIETEPIPAEGWGQRVDALLDRLETIPGALGPIGWGSGDTLGAVFEIDGAELAQALAAGLAAFETAVEAATIGIGKPRIRRLEITEAALEPDELMGATDVARLLGVSRQRVYQLMDDAAFPPPASHLARGALWSRADVEAWNVGRKVDV